ncbi:hypothetical protein P4K96_27965, partial [Bacillus cereus]|nr:hypothetical protein [Bacillus cereus]
SLARRAKMKKAAALSSRGSPYANGFLAHAYTLGMLQQIDQLQAKALLRILLRHAHEAGHILNVGLKIAKQAQQSVLIMLPDPPQPFSELSF